MVNGQGQTGKRGSLVVTLLLVVGVVLALVAVSYWHFIAGRHQPPSIEQPTPDNDDAGSAAWDPEAAYRASMTVRKQLDVAEAEGRVDDELVARAQRVAEQYPQDPQAHRLVADVLMARDDWAGAYTHLTRSLEADNQQPQVHLLAGTVAMKIDKLEAAARHFGVAVGLVPDDVTPRLYLATLYQHMGDDDKALRELLDARLIDRQSPRVYLMIADIYAGQRKWSLAITNIQHAIDHTPADDKDTLRIYNVRLARFLNKNNAPDQALLVLDRMPGKGHNDAYALEQRAIAQAMKRENIASAVLFEKASSLLDFNGDLMVQAVQQHILAGSRAGAQSALDQIVQQAPQQPEIEGLQMQIDDMPQPAVE